MKKDSLFLSLFLRDLRVWSVALLVIVGCATLVGLLTHHQWDGLLVSAGLLWFFFLPGLFLTYAILPTESAWLLRIAFSFTLSFATQPLIVFLLSRVGVPIQRTSSFVIATGMGVVGFLIAYFRFRSSPYPHKSNNEQP